MSLKWKKRGQVIRSAASVTQNHLKPEDPMLQSATPLRTCLLYRACHAKSIFPDPLQTSHACHRFWKCHKTPALCSLLARCRICCACHAKPHLNRKTTLQRPKNGPRRWCFYHLTSKCDPRYRYNGLRFFNISTPKSAPSMVWLSHFDFETFFAPQRRALFKPLNFQK